MPGRMMGIRIKKVRCLHLFVLALLAGVSYIFYISGVFEYPFQIPFMFYSYPLDVDLHQVIDNIKSQRPPGVEEINSYDFPHVLNNERKCQAKDVFLLLVVKSAVSHFVRRAFIRKTWGNERRVLGRKVVTVFILGERPGEISLERDIIKEHNHFGDIVQDTYMDSYWNNTLKLMQGFHWATENCRHARYLVFADDDYYISTDNLVKYVLSLSRKSVISGFVWDRAVPLRYKWSKWYTPLSEYPYWYWPPYPAGGAFVLPMNAAVDITIAMHYTKFIRFDDVYLGMIAYKLGIPMRHDSRFYVSKVPYSKELYRDLIACHGYDDSSEMMDVWRLENPKLRLRS